MANLFNPYDRFETVLFYGGPLDRQILTLQNSFHRFQIYVLKPWPVFGTETTKEVTVNTETITYYKNYYHYSANNLPLNYVAVMVAEDVDPNQVEAEMSVVNALCGFFL